MRQTLKEPCKECPFRRLSVQGRLGQSSGDPWDFLASFDHGESGLPCHKTVNWQSDDCQEKAQEAPLCYGSLVMLKNNCKLPRDRDLADAVNSVSPDRENVFSSSDEFMVHHHDHELVVRMRQ